MQKFTSPLSFHPNDLYQVNDRYEFFIRLITRKKLIKTIDIEVNTIYNP